MFTPPSIKWSGEDNLHIFWYFITPTNNFVKFKFCLLNHHRMEKIGLASMEKLLDFHFGLTIFVLGWWWWMGGGVGGKHLLFIIYPFEIRQKIIINFSEKIRPLDLIINTHFLLSKLGIFMKALNNTTTRRSKDTPLWSCHYKTLY